jgi:hypothetical protein
MWRVQAVPAGGEEKQPQNGFNDFKKNGTNRKPLTK